jgi:hypothetical protein
MYLFQYKRLKTEYQAATSLQAGRPYHPYRRDPPTVATPVQTEGTCRGYVPINRRAIPWLRPYKQEGHTVAQSFSLRPVTADVGVRSQISLYGVYGE